MTPADMLRALTARASVSGPMASLFARYAALMVEVDGAEDDGPEDAFREAVELQPEALAALSWARMEFAGWHIDCGEPERLDLWTLAMMDAALGVLRSAIEGGQAHG